MQVHARAGLCVYMCTASGRVCVRVPARGVCVCALREGGGGSALMERSGV